MTRAQIALVFSAFLIVAFGTDVAQSKESRYQPNWHGTPRPGGESTQALVKELDRLVDEAERARAADPLFLRDLRDLALRFSWPWHRRVLFDDFSDGDVTQNPSWAVEGRAVFVDRFAGVRTQVVPPYRPRQRDTDRRQSRQDLAVQLFATILDQSGGNQRQDQGPRQGHRPGRAPYEQPIAMKTAAALPNAFALRLSLASATPDTGRLEIGVTQGGNDLGYRVAYNAGGTPSVELVRVGSRGTAVVDTSRQPVALEDEAAHNLLVTRTADGTMAVSIDGEEIIRTRDQSFRDSFDGILIINKAGDFTVKSVTAYGG